MRQITSHHVNPCNQAIEVQAREPATGGAPTRYDIFGPRKMCGNAGMVPSFGLNMQFQEGPIADGINGITNEVLLAILIDRLEGFQSGPFANPFTESAIEHLKKAKACLENRTRFRADRGVEGTHTI